MSMSTLLGHLVVFLEAAVVNSEEDERGRYVWAVVISPRSDFAWKIERPTPENGQRFMLTPLDRDRLDLAGKQLAFITKEGIEHVMRHPYGRATGLWRPRT